MAASVLVPLCGCNEDDPVYVQVNDEENCLSLRVTSAQDCGEEEAAATADLTCCTDSLIGQVTATPGCGALGDSFDIDVVLEAESEDVDLSEVARVTVVVPNQEEALTEYRLAQSDLQDNLWEISLSPGELGGADRTDEVCFRVWEIDEEGSEDGDDDSGS